MTRSHSTWPGPTKFRTLNQAKIILACYNHWKVVRRTIWYGFCIDFSNWALWVVHMVQCTFYDGSIFKWVVTRNVNPTFSNIRPFQLGCFLVDLIMPTVWPILSTKPKFWPIFWNKSNLTLWFLDFLELFLTEDTAGPAWHRMTYQPFPLTPASHV